MNRKYIENSRDPLRQVISRNTEFLSSSTGKRVNIFKTSFYFKIVKELY